MTQAQLNRTLWDITGQLHETLKTLKKELIQPLFLAIDEART